ncbi:hypothetical protein [Vibrio parahaemolyticus]|uniref:hypothetical protein n=1 Tax=Vibrio parahaemolyticus TaxID=670 RepID=UPI001EEC93B5|nr:hypothetical protein [Vibrio parahaemolyticus]MCG6443638.1 hypothetical protein [Vibrio parahaemolyticus]MCG6455972.1 hypothetical protein [Vibrio parahaemolyticus]HCE2195150.1 hypothetical protein [Vibrio parahaemolyticus]HCG6674123.1 hypothetical protein [Vibrio parahaemolyticus]HCG7224917.1 hypothetical protein [Vibrio parahaemolyticus]
MKNHQLPQKVKLDRFKRRIASKKIKKSNYFDGTRQLSYTGVVRKSPWKAKKQIPYIEVLAPEIIDFYKPKHFERSNHFIKELQKKIKSTYKSRNQTIKICFRNTKYITAAAAINLFSETSRSVRKYPGLKYSVSSAPKVKIKDVSVPLVESVLNRLGFYELLGLKKRSMKEIQSVRCWHQANGTLADGALAGRVIKELEKFGVEKSVLYRSSVEAISNAVEHGYDKNIKSNADISDKTWWMFAAVLENKLTILVADLGHGIPNTLEKTQDSSILDEIWGMLGIKATKDCELIHASTLVKKTQTLKSNRGKGGKDLTSLVDLYPKSSLTIFSNRGIYRYHGKSHRRQGISYDNKTPINGTIVEWSIPLS